MKKQTTLNSENNTTISTEETVVKKRGRPRKNSETIQLNEDVSANNTADEKTIKKTSKRKKQDDSQLIVQENIINPIETAPEPVKKRGRKKAESQDKIVDNDTSINVTTVETVVEPVKKRGRKKAENQDEMVDNDTSINVNSVENELQNITDSKIETNIDVSNNDIISQITETETIKNNDVEEIGISQTVERQFPLRGFHPVNNYGKPLSEQIFSVAPLEEYFKMEEVRWFLPIVEPVMPMAIKIQKMIEYQATLHAGLSNTRMRTKNLLRGFKYVSETKLLELCNWEKGWIKLLLDEPDIIKPPKEPIMNGKPSYPMKLYLGKRVMAAVRTKEYNILRKERKKYVRLLSEYNKINNPKLYYIERERFLKERADKRAKRKERIARQLAALPKTPEEKEAARKAKQKVKVPNAPKQVKKNKKPYHNVNFKKNNFTKEGYSDYKNKVVVERKTTASGGRRKIDPAEAKAALLALKAQQENITHTETNTTTAQAATTPMVEKINNKEQINWSQIINGLEIHFGGNEKLSNHTLLNDAIIAHNQNSNNKEHLSAQSNKELLNQAIVNYILNDIIQYDKDLLSDMYNHPNAEEYSNLLYLKLINAISKQYPDYKTTCRKLLALRLK